MQAHLESSFANAVTHESRTFDKFLAASPSAPRWIDTPQSDGTIAGYSRDLGSEHVEYLLRRDGATLVCDRILVQSDGSRLVQSLAVEDVAGVRHFVLSDWFANALDDDLEHFLALCKAHLPSSLPITEVEAQDFEHAQQILSDLLDCRCQADMVRCAQGVARYAGAQNLVFALTNRSGATTNAQYLVGCDPAFVQTYVARRWYTIDPFAIYSARGTQPVLGRELELRSRGQVDLRLAAEHFGFASVMAIPTRLSAELYGHLMIGSPTPAVLGEPILHRHRSLLRILALEIFDWVRKRSHGAVTLSPDEKVLLQYVDEGLESRDVAAILGTTECMVNKRYSRLNAKLRVKHKVFALQAAIDLGLLYPAYSIMV